jgi:hypothetical protein
MADTQDVLTTASSVTCTHGGVVDISSDAKLTVGAAGDRVLLQAGVMGKSFKTAPPCSNLDNPNTGALQCKHVVTVTGGTSSKLRVGGQPVLLASLAGTTDGVPPPPLAPPSRLGSAQAGQTKLRAT